jgi:hypothetical protein
VQWRTIKNENRKNYARDEEATPPQALHIDIDQNHANRYTEPAARLWRKGAKNRVNGLQLRLIPCLGSNCAIALLDNQRSNMVLMAAKQQYFMNSYMVKLDNPHILNLDAPIQHSTTHPAFNLQRSYPTKIPNESIPDELGYSKNICLRQQILTRK